MEFADHPGVLFGTHRFDDFQNRLAIASNILSQRLARLTERGVLTARSTDSERGYHLTDKGLDLYPVVLAMLMGETAGCPAESRPSRSPTPHADEGYGPQPSAPTAGNNLVGELHSCAAAA